MKRYRFKLQTLLDHRKAREDELLTQLGALRQEEAQEEAHLQHLVHRLDEANCAVEQALQENSDATIITRWDDYAKATRDDIKVQELTIEAVRARVEAKRIELVDAMKERQTLEKLREKQETDYIKAGQRAEQNELDDMAAVRYARSA